MPNNFQEQSTITTRHATGQRKPKQTHYMPYKWHVEAQRLAGTLEATRSLVAFHRWQYYSQPIQKTLEDFKSLESCVFQMIKRARLE